MALEIITFIVFMPVAKDKERLRLATMQTQQQTRLISMSLLVDFNNLCIIASKDDASRSPELFGGKDAF